MSELHAGLADIFEVDEDQITSDTWLADLNWDSLAMVSTVALFDDLYDKEVKLADLKACQTIADLEALATG